MKKITAILVLCIFLISIGAAYAADGDVLWERSYDGGNYNEAYGVATDSQNNVIVAGSSDDDYYTIKYDPNGNELWKVSYDGGGNDYANGVATDSQNNIIVTGYSQINHDGTINNDYYTIKYDPNGNELWKVSYDGGGNDYAIRVATDSQNNIIVTGYSENVDNNYYYDYYTIKYDPNGNVIWAESYNSGDDDSAYGVATDSQNNVIVTGSSNDDYYTIKYDPNGNVIWAESYNSGDDDSAYGVATDSQNNIIVTGVSNNGNDDDYYTIKYDPNGNVIWEKSYNNKDVNGDDYANDVATDSQNNIIVTGVSENGSDSDYYTIKYDPNGNVIWEKSYDGKDYDTACGVATDSQNNAIVTGYSYNGSKNVYYTIKYQGSAPTRNKSLPIVQILKILKLYPKE